MSKQIKKTWPVILLAVAFAAAFVAAPALAEQKFEEKFEKTVPLTQAGKLSLNNVSGGSPRAIANELHSSTPGLLRPEMTSLIAVRLSPDFRARSACDQSRSSNSLSKNLLSRLAIAYILS